MHDRSTIAYLGQLPRSTVQIGEELRQLGMYRLGRGDQQRTPRGWWVELISQTEAFKAGG